MRKFQRGPEPEVLGNNWQQWGDDWDRRKKANPKASFHWHQVGGEPVNQLILPTLKAQTQSHCSFCDNFPVSPPSLETVEHFRPKSKFPREAYHWPNLYFCCDFCQQKSNDFDEALLRPDAEDFDFDRYFRWDFTTGTLEINAQATPADQQRAETTRAMYRLNDRHPALRKRALRQRAKDQDAPLDDFPYREFLRDQD